MCMQKYLSLLNRALMCELTANGKSIDCNNAAFTCPQFKMHRKRAFTLRCVPSIALRKHPDFIRCIHRVSHIYPIRVAQLQLRNDGGGRPTATGSLTIHNNVYRSVGRSVDVTPPSIGGVGGGVLVHMHLSMNAAALA